MRKIRWVRMEVLGGFVIFISSWLWKWFSTDMKHYYNRGWNWQADSWEMFDFLISRCSTECVTQSHPGKRNSWKRVGFCASTWPSMILWAFLRTKVRSSIHTPCLDGASPFYHLGFSKENEKSKLQWSVLVQHRASGKSNSAPQCRHSEESHPHGTRLRLKSANINAISFI